MKKFTIISILSLFTIILIVSGYSIFNRIVNPSDLKAELGDGICGDGTLDPGEQCDDGNNTNGDRCDEFCELEPFCGDGTLDDQGTCATETDRCGTDNVGIVCEVEHEEECCIDSGNTWCPGEECDDANNINGDGCSSTCQEEGCGEGNDDDGDGVCNADDNCQFVSNSDQSNIDEEPIRATASDEYGGGRGDNDACLEDPETDTTSYCANDVLNRNTFECGDSAKAHAFFDANGVACEEDVECDNNYSCVNGICGGVDGETQISGHWVQAEFADIFAHDVEIWETTGGAENGFVTRVDVTSPDGKLTTVWRRDNNGPDDAECDANTGIIHRPLHIEFGEFLWVRFVNVYVDVDTIDYWEEIDKIALSTDNVGDVCDLQTCGDTIIQGSEQCDDGMFVNGDGCSNSCQQESGWQCTGKPSVCTQIGGGGGGGGSSDPRPGDYSGGGGGGGRYTPPQPVTESVSPPLLTITTAPGRPSGSVTGGIFRGFENENNKFKGGEPLARKDALLAVYRLGRLIEGKPAVSFKDENIRQIIKESIDKGIVVDNENGDFRGEDPIKNIELVKIIINIIDMKNEDRGNKYHTGPWEIRVTERARELGLFREEFKGNDFATRAGAVPLFEKAIQAVPSLSGITTIFSNPKAQESYEAYLASQGQGITTVVRASAVPEVVVAQPSHPDKYTEARLIILEGALKKVLQETQKADWPSVQQILSQIGYTPEQIEEMKFKELFEKQEKDILEKVLKETSKPTTMLDSLIKALDILQN